MVNLKDVLDQAGKHKPKYVAPFGLTEEVVRQIAEAKNEPVWMREKRLAALSYFLSTPLPDWGPDLQGLDFSKITYFVRPNTQQTSRWDEVPSEIRDTFEKLGIPEAERKLLGGVGAQFDSDMVYHKLKESLQAKGVIFENMDSAVQKYPNLVEEYFMTRCVPIHDHKFTMLHAAVWSGGTFIYVPKGVKVDIPLQAYFRMNSDHGGQFEHTLIIADEGSEVHYIEGCSAPRYQAAALHAGCVEIYVKRYATVKYSSIENWSKNTFNLNTKRAIVDEGGTIAWLNGNTGSGTTMLYPMSILRGRGAKSSYIGLAFAGKDQVQDTGHKVAIVAPDCAASVRSKSISVDGGVATYRGLVKVTFGGERAQVAVHCDSLLLDNQSVAKAIPVITNDRSDAQVVHEARVGRLGEREMFYVESRGLSEAAATRLLVGGFVEPVIRELPLEYAVELMHLLELEMAGVREV